MKEIQKYVGNFSNELISNWLLINWECLSVMDELIKSWIKIDAIITDIPYWTTVCKWDIIIPFDKMWERLNKLIKPNGAIVLFGSEPFSSALRMSNIKNYKYDWIWEKQKASNFLNSNNQPLKIHETISVFNTFSYNPQMRRVIEIEDILQMNKKELEKYHYNRDYQNFWKIDKRKTINNPIQKTDWVHRSWNKWIRRKDNWLRKPISVIKINKDVNNNPHPTAKPVALMEYLIKTYTNEWELVLDFTAWSFTTAVACENTNRKWIWIEISEEYCNIWKERIIKNRIEN